MLNKIFESKYLEWDSRYFGVPSARFYLNQVVDGQTQEKLLNLFQKYKFVTISNVDNHYENNYWIGSKTDAFLVDINIKFQKKLGEQQAFNPNNIYVTNMLSDNKEIVDIAKKSFTYSRFYNDPMLERDKTSNIYAHWTKNAFQRKDKFFVISKNNEKITGFILFSFKKNTSIIELIAVDNRYQGQKIGRALIKKLESYLISENIHNVEVGTQINNAKAIQFYSKLGFSYMGCTSNYHLWPKEGRS